MSTRIYRKRHETSFLFILRKHWTLWLAEILTGLCIGTAFGLIIAYGVTR